MLEKLLGKDWQTADDAEERIDELVDRIIQKLQQQGYITPSPDLSAEQHRRGGGGGEGEAGEVRFEITDKSLDFLGYRALRDLMGSIGKSSLGRHDTREMATGIEASGAPKPVRIRRHHEPRRVGRSTRGDTSAETGRCRSRASLGGA